MYSSVTVTQIINGNHHNRALAAHQITLQVLFDRWFDAFLEDHPAVRDHLQLAAKEMIDACRTVEGIHKAHLPLLMKLESVNLEKTLQDHDDSNIQDPMYVWARMDMNQVMALLQFQQATLEGNWLLYLSALEKLCVYLQQARLRTKYT